MVDKKIQGDYSIFKLTKNNIVNLTFFEWNDSDYCFKRLWQDFHENLHEKMTIENFNTFLNFYNIIDYLGIVLADKIYQTLESGLIFCKECRQNNNFGFKLCENYDIKTDFVNWAFNEDKNLQGKILDYKTYPFEKFKEEYKNSYIMVKKVCAFDYDFYLLIKHKNYRLKEIQNCKDVYLFHNRTCTYYRISSITLYFKQNEVVAKINGHTIPWVFVPKFCEQFFFGEKIRRKCSSRNYFTFNIRDKKEEDNKNYKATSSEDELGIITDDGLKNYSQYTRDQEESNIIYKAAINYEDFYSKYELGMTTDDVLKNYFNDIIIFQITKNLYYQLKNPIKLEENQKLEIGALIKDLPGKIIPKYWFDQLFSGFPQIMHFPENYCER